MSSPPPIPLAALHEQILALERQKTAITAQLLSLRATHPLSSVPLDTTTVPKDSSQEPLTDAEHLSAVFAASAVSATSTIARLHRISGITTFTVRDPSPPHATLLGIRIEVFSNRQFHNPHYLHISFPTDPNPDPKAAPYTIHRHTIPPFISLPKPMPMPPLPTLARTLRRQLTLHARRVAAATEMKRSALTAGRLGDVTEEWTNRVEGMEWDAGVSVIEVRWGNGTKGWVCIGEDGAVGRVVILGRAGKRCREVEKKVKGGKGRLEGIAGRMGWC